MNQMRMIKSKGWVTNTEIETIRRKIENEGREEVNGGTIQKGDNIAGINDEYVKMLKYVKITTFTQCRNVNENRRRRSRHEEIKIQRTTKNLPGKEGS